MPDVARTCDIAECINEARKGGLCWAHLYRRRMGLPMSSPLRRYSKATPWQTLLQAIDDFADSIGEVGALNAELAYLQAEWRLKKAVRVYVRNKRQVRPSPPAPPVSNRGEGSQHEDAQVRRTVRRQRR